MSRFIRKFPAIIFRTMCVALIAILSITGCSSRENTPKLLDDGTTIYPSKTQDGIFVKITLSNKLSLKSGKPLKPDSSFSLKNKAKIYATIDLFNYKLSINKELLFHVDWLDSAGNSLYKKRIDFFPNDSVHSIVSSISISPDKRKVGSYSICVYLFRELIAEKKFQITELKKDSTNSKQKSKSDKKETKRKKTEVKKTQKPKVKTEAIKADITLCRKLSKKTGKPIGVDTVFTINDKEKIKAIVNIEKSEIKTNEQLKFYFNWIGPDEKSFYKKRIVYTTSKPSFTISNSVSISPDKRKPGIYKLQIIYRKKIIAEKKFELVAQKN